MILRFASSPASADAAQTIRNQSLSHADEQAWLTDILACVGVHPVQRLDKLLPELASNCNPLRSGMTLHVNKVYHVTPSPVDLGENEDWRFDVRSEMEIKDGVISVHGSEKMVSGRSPNSVSKT
ncbi:hypothetical protein [Bradyrhizobium sp. 5.13L]